MKKIINTRLVNRSIVFSLFTAMVFLFTACPYSSTVPIDQPLEKVDKKLMGKWVKSSDTESENPDYYEFEKLDANRYNLTHFEWSSNEEKYTETKYLTHSTTLGDHIFLNMQKDGEGEYYLHYLDFHEGDEFTLYEITDNIDEKFNTSAELKAFVTANMKHSFFYNKDEVRYLKQK